MPQPPLSIEQIETGTRFLDTGELRLDAEIAARVGKAGYLSPSTAIDMLHHCPASHAVGKLVQSDGEPDAANRLGTVVHSAFEALMALDGEQRTPDALSAILDALHTEYVAKHAVLTTDMERARRVRTRLTELSSGLFDILDPKALNVIGREVRIRTKLGGYRTELVVDLLHTAPVRGKETVVVSDYKTGRSHPEHKLQVQLYGAAISGARDYQLGVEGAVPSECDTKLPKLPIHSGKLLYTQRTIGSAGKSSSVSMKPADIDTAVQDFSKAGDMLADALSSGVFPTKKFNGCSYCPLVKACPTSGKVRRESTLTITPRGDTTPHSAPALVTPQSPQSPQSPLTESDDLMAESIFSAPMPATGTYTPAVSVNGMSAVTAALAPPHLSEHVSTPAPTPVAAPEPALTPTPVAAHAIGGLPEGIQVSPGFATDWPMATPVAPALSLVPEAPAVPVTAPVAPALNPAPPLAPQAPVLTVVAPAGEPAGDLVPEATPVLPLVTSAPTVAAATPSGGLAVAVATYSVVARAMRGASSHSAELVTMTSGIVTGFIAAAKTAVPSLTDAEALDFVDAYLAASPPPYVVTLQGVQRPGTPTDFETYYAAHTQNVQVIAGLLPGLAPVAATSAA